MRIAQTAPLWEQVPPPAYGGTELVRRDHAVTLFATGDSKTLAKLEPCCPQALRGLETNQEEFSAYQTLQLDKVFQRADEFDLIHSHVGISAFPYAKLVKQFIDN